MVDLAGNEWNATEFYDLLNQCQPRKAIERYGGAASLQRNPGVAAAKTASSLISRTQTREYPGKHLESKRVIAQGDYGNALLPGVATVGWERYFPSR
jgi:hypothetical protein